MTWRILIAWGISVFFSGWIVSFALPGLLPLLEVYFTNLLISGTVLLPLLITMLIIHKVNEQRSVKELLRLLNRAHIWFYVIIAIAGTIFIFKELFFLIGILIWIAFLLVLLVITSISLLALYLIFRKKNKAVLLNEAGIPENDQQGNQQGTTRGLSMLQKLLIAWVISLLVGTVVFSLLDTSFEWRFYGNSFGYMYNLGRDLQFSPVYYVPLLGLQLLVYFNIQYKEPAVIVKFLQRSQLITLASVYFLSVIFLIVFSFGYPIGESLVFYSIPFLSYMITGALIWHLVFNGYKKSWNAIRLLLKEKEKKETDNQDPNQQAVNGEIL